MILFLLKNFLNIIPAIFKFFVVSPFRNLAVLNAEMPKMLGTKIKNTRYISGAK